jgi:hypothetical protein
VISIVGVGVAPNRKALSSKDGNMDSPKSHDHARAAMSERAWARTDSSAEGAHINGS